MATSLLPGCKFWRELADGVAIAVKVTPRSRHPGLAGVAADAETARLRIGVREAAEDGRANRAACASLAAALGIPPGAVSVSAGATNRRKTLRVIGEPALLAARLAALCREGA